MADGPGTAEQAKGATMNEQEQKAGRERVREHLVKPLDETLRLRRPRKIRTGAAHKAALDEICDRLWYLSEDDLFIVRETIIRTLTPEAEWPPAAVVIGWGQTLRRKPEGVSQRVVRLVQWAAAKDGIDDAILPAFYRWLQHHNRVPGAFDMREIARTASENDRWVERMREVATRGVLTPVDAQRLAVIEADRATVAAIVAQFAGVA